MKCKQNILTRCSRELDAEIRWKLSDVFRFWDLARAHVCGHGGCEWVLTCPVRAVSRGTLVTVDLRRRWGRADNGELWKRYIKTQCLEIRSTVRGFRFLHSVRDLALFNQASDGHFETAP